MDKVITEEDLNEILDKIEEMHNLTAEQAEEQLDKMLEDLEKVKAQNLLTPTRLVEEKANPYREYFKEPARFESQAWGDWILD